MKPFIAISNLLYIFMLINCTCCKSVNQLIVQVVDEVRPCQSLLWTNLDERFESSSKHLPSYQIALKNLLSTTPTKQVNINTLKSLTEYREVGGLLFNLNFSASLHFIIIVADSEYFYFDKLKNVLETIEASIMYFSVPKF